MFQIKNNKVGNINSNVHHNNIVQNVDNSINLNYHYTVESMDDNMNEENKFDVCHHSKTDSMSQHMYDNFNNVTTNGGNIVNTDNSINYNYTIIKKQYYINDTLLCEPPKKRQKISHVSKNNNNRKHNNGYKNDNEKHNKIIQRKLCLTNEQKNDLRKGLNNNLIMVKADHNENEKKRKGQNKRTSKKKLYYCSVLVQKLPGKFICLCNNEYDRTNKHAVKLVNQCVKFHLRTYCGLPKHNVKKKK
eukprot:109431_1